MTVEVRTDVQLSLTLLEMRGKNQWVSGHSNVPYRAQTAYDS